MGWVTFTAILGCMRPVGRRLDTPKVWSWVRFFSLSAHKYCCLLTPFRLEISKVPIPGNPSMALHCLLKFIYTLYFVCLCIYLWRERERQRQRQRERERERERKNESGKKRKSDMKSFQNSKLCASWNQVIEMRIKKRSRNDENLIKTSDSWATLT